VTLRTFIDSGFLIVKRMKSCRSGFTSNLSAAYSLAAFRSEYCTLRDFTADIGRQ